jgi:hypothetical protein
MADLSHPAPTGFAGLASLVSDVEPVIREAQRRMAEQAQNPPASEPVERQPHTARARDSAQARRDTSRQRTVSGPSFRWGRLLLVGAGVGFVALVISENENTTPSPTAAPNEAPTAAPTASPSSSAPDFSGLGLSPSNEPTLVEQRPEIGGSERVLDRAEIRYCLAEKIRLDAAEPAVNEYRAADVDRFNAYVDDYNLRCGRFKYRDGTLEGARAEVERHRAALVEEGRARFADRTTSSSSNEQARPAPARLTAPGRAPTTSAEASGGPAEVSEATARQEVTTAQTSVNMPDAAPARPVTRRQRENLATCMSGQFASLCDHSLLSTSEAAKVAAAERNANYQTCVSGEYPALCDHDRLTSDEGVAVAAAERRANFRTCSSGEFPALCRHDLLTAEQASEVRAAEGRANYRTCSSGQFRALCRYELLTPEQLSEVRAAERRENYRTCISGRFPSICNHSLLSSEEADRVAAAERRAQRP